MKSLLRTLAVYFKKVKTAVELGKYDRFTIAEYFRNQGAQVGEGCNIIPRTLGPEPYLVKIGNRVSIATGVTFVTHDGAARVFLEDQEPDIRVFGTITIEDGCVIGQNVVLMPNIKIGKNSIVGAGSVVISDLPPNIVAMGVPARVLSSIEAYKRKTLARWEEQRLPSHYYEFEDQPDGPNAEKHRENRAKIIAHLKKILWKEKDTDVE